MELMHDEELKRLLEEVIQESNKEEFKRLLKEYLYETKYRNLYTCIKEGPSAFSRNRKWKSWCEKRIEEFKKNVDEVIKRNNWDLVEAIEAVYSYADKENVLETDWGFYGNLVATMEELDETDLETVIKEALEYWEA